MEVLIHGPNLNEQSKGQFHVHRDGCADNYHYGPYKRFGGEEYPMTVSVSCRLDVEDYIYGPDAGDFDLPHPGAWLDEFHFAPCCSNLPHLTKSITLDQVVE
jgi:hypothetical protein